MTGMRLRRPRKRLEIAARQARNRSSRRSPVSVRLPIIGKESL